jgi:signal transduction histidine kinase
MAFAALAAPGANAADSVVETVPWLMAFFLGFLLAVVVLLVWQRRGSKSHLSAPSADSGHVPENAATVWEQTLVRSLDAQSQHLRLVMDALPTPLLVLGKTGEIQYTNSACERLLGTDMSALVGSEVWRWLPDINWAEVLQNGREDKHALECALPENNGERQGIALLVNLARATLRDSTSWVAFLTVIERPELERLAVEALFDLSPNYIAVLDQNGKVLRHNEAWFDWMAANNRLFLQGRAIGDFLTLETDEPLEVILDAMKAEPGLSVTRKEHCWLGRGLKQTRELEMNLIWQKQSRRFYAIGRDVTKDRAVERARIEAARKLAEANQKLMEVDKLKSLFIASMSHELRTPLNSVIGFTSLLLEGMAGDLSEEQSAHLTRVLSSAKHLLALITDVIDISKIESGHVEVHLEDFELMQLARECIDEHLPQAEQKSLKLRIEGPQRLDMYSDCRRVRQVMLNFLSNAVKYSDSGTITLMVEDQGDMVRLAVRDQGIGIPQDEQGLLFKPFVRLEPKRITEAGTGLGLYLTHKIVVGMLQGKLELKSRVGEGSEFAAVIPRRLSANVTEQENGWKNQDTHR